MPAPAEAVPQREELQHCPQELARPGPIRHQHDTSGASHHIRYMCKTRATFQMDFPHASSRSAEEFAQPRPVPQSRAPLQEAEAFAYSFSRFTELFRKSSLRGTNHFALHNRGDRLLSQFTDIHIIISRHLSKHIMSLDRVAFRRQKCNCSLRLHSRRLCFSSHSPKLALSMTAT